MILQGQAAIGFLDLLVRGIGRDTQHLVGIFQRRSSQVEQLVDDRSRQAHKDGYAMQLLHLLGVNLAIGLRYLAEVRKQLQQLLLGHHASHLLATELYLSVPFRLAHRLTFLEKSAQDVIALLHRRGAETAPQELADEFHLGVHHLAIRLNDMGRQQQQREQETVSFTHVTGLRLLIRSRLSLSTLEEGIEQRPQRIARQGTDRAAGQQAEEPSNPLYSHLYKDSISMFSGKDKNIYTNVQEFGGYFIFLTLFGT